MEEEDMTDRCCLCGKFIGEREFIDDKITIDFNIEIIDMWGNIREWEDIYHKKCGDKYELSKVRSL